MASKISFKVEIEVKNGDALSNNRTHGNSNTGTYFLASSTEFEKIYDLMKCCNSYQFDSDKIKEYKILFNTFMFDYSYMYLDKFESFNKYCEELLESCIDYEVSIKIRKNDNRYFLRFENNEDYVVEKFRHILYGDFTSIVLEFYKNKCKIYPVISNYVAYEAITSIHCDDF